MKSKNNDVAKFLADAEIHDNAKYKIIECLREIAFDIFPNLNETFKYGGILLSSNDQFGGLFISKKHVSFEFSFGYQLESSLNLEGSGKYRRHLKFKELSDIKKKEMKDLLKQIKNIDSKTI